MTSGVMARPSWRSGSSCCSLTRRRPDVTANSGRRLRARTLQLPRTLRAASSRTTGCPSWIASRMRSGVPASPRQLTRSASGSSDACRPGRGRYDPSSQVKGPARARTGHDSRTIVRSLTGQRPGKTLGASYTRASMRRTGRPRAGGITRPAGRAASPTACRVPTQGTRRPASAIQVDVARSATSTVRTSRSFVSPRKSSGLRVCSGKPSAMAVAAISRSIALRPRALRPLAVTAA
jgi:hypothetical protein